MTAKSVYTMGGVVALCVVLCAIPAWGQMAVAPEGSTGTSDQSVSLSISSTEAAEAMSMLSEATGYSILLSSKVTGKLTAFIRDMNPEQALGETCKVNGLDFVRNGHVVWVVTHDEYVQDFQLRRRREVVALKYAHALEVSQALSSKGVLSKDATVIPYPENNVILIAEQADRIQDALDLIAQLDRHRTTRVFPLQYAAASDILGIIQSYTSNPSAVQADLRTNQLMITETDAHLATIEGLIRQFDQPDRMETRTIPLKYAQAESVAQLLREILTGQKSSSSQTSDSSEPTSSNSASSTKQNQPTAPAARQSGSIAPPPISTGGTQNAAPTTNAAAAAPAAAPVSAGSSPVLTNGVATGGSAPEGGQDAALGALATVVAEPRTNTVIVTHIASVLDRLEEVVKSVDVPSDFHVYQFQNVNPADIEVEGRLGALLSKDSGYVNVDALSRKVTFRASTAQAEEILDLLRQWDELVRQVHIEAEILTVNSTLIRQLGVKWQAVLDEVKNGQKLNRITGEINFPAAIGDKANQARVTIGNLEEADYTALIQALSTDNDTHVIASPKILVRDREEATFSSTRDEPYTVVTVDGNTQTTLQDVRFLNVGTTLRVQPVINSQGLINLKVQLELSNLVEIRNNVPVADRSTAQSNVSVRDGGTVILGGLRQRTRKEGEQGVPGLRKVPIVGHLFRTEEKTNAEQEIVLILRPTLVGPSTDNPPTIASVQQDVDVRASEKRLDVQDEKRQP